MTSQAPHYHALEQQLRQTTHLAHILSLAQWDAETMLAPGAAPSRQREIATVSAILHQMRTASEVGRLIEAAVQEEGVLDAWQRANLRLAQKAYEEAKCISPEMQEAYSNIVGECEFVWRTARKNNDFKQLAPYLDRLFDVTRKMARIKADYFGKNPYDVLLDAYNPDFTSTSVQEIYIVLKAELPSLIQAIVAKQAAEQVVPLTAKIDVAIQKALGLKVLEKMGFSLEHGRLDESAHPFCSGTNDDIRLTTRYDETNFLSAFTSTIHEAGHGLYQQNLPRAYRDQPVGACKGLAFHESQSIIMERQAVTSPAFMECLSQLLRDEFGLQGPAYEAENLYKLLTRVSPSFVRIEADEVTYPLHVILRFEIEQAIVDGSVQAKDLPTLWNEKMQEYLGITPATDTLGCMQDIHWPSGRIGYFPAYTNGAIMASMLMQTARQKHSTIDTELRSGSFESLNHYLTDNLRQFGSFKSSADLLAEATGYTTIQPRIFVDYLKQKYL
ncbi:MAG: carboxypeptidase M32 [Bacteroidota bacterium]